MDDADRCFEHSIDVRRDQDDRLELGPCPGRWYLTRVDVVDVAEGLAHGSIDKEILCDAANMYKMNRIRRVVTTDNNHMYSNRERINTILGLAIVFIKTEFIETTPLSSSDTE